MQSIEFASKVNDEDEPKKLDGGTEPFMPAALGPLKFAEEVKPLALHLPSPPPPPPKSLQTYAKPPPPLRGDVNATSTGAAAALIGSSIPIKPSCPPPPPPRREKAAAKQHNAYAPPPLVQPMAERWDEDLARWVPHFFKELEGDPFMENRSNAKSPWQETCDVEQTASADSASDAVVPSAARKRRNKIPVEHSESDVSRECELVEPLSFAPNPSPDGETLTNQLRLVVGNLLDGQWWDMCGLVGTVQGHVFRLAHHETSDVYDISIDPKHLKVSMCLLGENMDIELA